MTRILLVEDDLDVRIVLEHVLIDADYRVDAVGTMASGENLLNSRSYDLVIADAKLPDGSGLEVADKAREHGAKALVITGYAFTLPRAEPAHAYEILLKPLHPTELIDAVGRALESRQSVG